MKLDCAVNVVLLRWPEFIKCELAIKIDNGSFLVFELRVVAIQYFIQNCLLNSSLYCHAVQCNSSCKM